MSEKDDQVVESIYRVSDLYWKKDNEASDDWVLVKLTSVNVEACVGTCALIDERTGSRMPNQTESVQLHTATLCPANPLFTTCADMTSLRYLHEAALLKNLYDRWIAADRQPYTSMSNVLIAVNPLRYLKKLEKAVFVSQSLDKSPPHPYNVAENAYRQLRTVKQNQSIIISGESGSGKTETSKIILDFLTERSKFTGGSPAVQPRSNQDDERPVRTEHGLGERLMKTIPILESFGNAKTHRNHNSSRFGKYMRLQFSPDVDVTSTALHLTGASIDTYLLETSRVVHPPTGERNFHVFYELLRSGDAKLLNDLKLIPNPYMPKDAGLTNCDAWLDQYHYLNRSGCTESPFLNDRVNFQNLKDALAFADISAVELFRVVAGVLHLGNLSFDEEDTAEGMTAVIHREDAPEASIDVIADLLGIKSDDLIDALLKKKIERTKGSFQRRGSVYFVGKTKQQASYSRDTVAKMIYDQVFSALMYQCADILEYNIAMKEELPYIGVLDIFGFEDFEPKNQNSFEQLLINYANEALQSMFNQCILKAEQELYHAENIWAPQNASLLFPFAPVPEDAVPATPSHNDSTKEISYDDNRECLSLIADRRDGILSMLNLAGRLAGQTDRKFNEKLHHTFKKHPCFVVPHPRDVPRMFCVKHYAGVVRYHIEGFIDKNNNVASPQFKELIAGSTLALLNKASFHAPSTTPQGSVSEMFSFQMKGLVVELDSTRNNFIRCIKPNAAMDVAVFDRRSVLEQLRCSGTIQACQVLQVGLPTRVSYEELVFIYSEFLGAPFMERFRDCDRLFTQALCKVLDFPSDAFRLGDTRLFFKTGKIHLLDSVLAVTPPLPPATLKARLVSYLAKSRWVTAATKVVVLRACEDLYWNCRQGRCAIVLQCWFRQQLAKMRVAKLRTQHRVSHKWNVVVQKLQVRAAFDRSVEDKLALLNVLLRHKTLPPNAKWLLTWLGPLQRAMYVRKLGRAACVAYLAKRAFSALLEKVRRQRAAVKLQSQFRRVLAVKHFQKMVEQHRARVRWARIRLMTKVNICFLAMYRRAHVIGLERSVSSLAHDNVQLSESNVHLTEKVASLELAAAAWTAKESALASTAEALELQLQAATSDLAANETLMADMVQRLESLQHQLDGAEAARALQQCQVERLEKVNADLTASSTDLWQKFDELDKMYALSKERNVMLVAESNQRVDKFATEVDALQNKMNDAKHDIRLKSAQISELEEYNAELKDENETLSTQLEDMEQLHEREMATQVRQVTALTADVEALRLLLAAANEEIERKSMHLTELDTIHYGMSIKQGELEGCIASLNGNVADLVASLRSAHDEAASLNSSLAQLRVDLDEATRSSQAKSSELTAMASMSEEYKDECSQLKDKMVLMQRVLAESKEKELALALETQQAANEAQVAVLVSQLKEVQAELKEALAEVERQNKTAEEFDLFKQQTSVDSSALRAKMVTLTTFLAESKAKEVTMDAMLTDRDAEILELTRQRQADQMRFGEVAGELELTQHALKEKSATVEELIDVREQLLQVHASLTQELDAMKYTESVSKQVEAELDDQLKERSQRVVELGSQLKHMQLRLDQVQERIAVKDVVVLAEETMKMQLKVDNDVLAHKVEASKKAINDVRLSELELSSQLSAKTIEIMSLQSQLEIRQSEVAASAKQVESLQRKLADVDARAGELAQANAQLQARVALLEKPTPKTNVGEPVVQPNTANDHITSLTTELLNIQHQISQASDQVELKTPDDPELDALRHQMTLNTLTLTEKMAELVQATTEANVRQIQLEQQVAHGAQELVQLKSQLEEANEKLHHTEAQLDATLANAMELKATSTKLREENASMGNQLARPNSKIEVVPLQKSPQPGQLESSSSLPDALDVTSREPSPRVRSHDLPQASEKTVAQLPSDSDLDVAKLAASNEASSSLPDALDVTSQDTEQTIAQLTADLELATAKLVASDAIIRDMQNNERDLANRIADSNDHIFALEAQLDHFLAKHDDELDPAEDVQELQLMDFTKSYREAAPAMTQDLAVYHRSDLETQLKATTTNVVANHRGLPTSLNAAPGLLPNVQAVFISMAPVDSSLSHNSRQELEHRLDANNDKVEALEAKLKLLEVKHELSLNESRAKESIAHLKATIAEKETVILDLRCQLRLSELSAASGAERQLSQATASPATLIASPDLSQANPAHLLEMQAIRHQNANRRVRKVVLQSRW